MKVKLIKDSRKRFDEAKRVATREGQRLCRNQERAYCRGETWITVQCRTSDGKTIGHYEIFQEPFFHDAYPSRKAIDWAIKETESEVYKQNWDCNSITFYVETQVYSYNTAYDFGREFPTPHDNHVCEEIAEVTRA